MQQALEISPLHKAAIILLSLDEAEAASVMKEMNFQEVERVSFAMYNLKNVDYKTKKAVVKDFVRSVQDDDKIIGNKATTKSILSAFLSNEEMESIVRNLQQNKDLWDAISNIHPEVLALYFAKEKVNIVAIILSKMHTRQVAEVLGFMDDDVAGEVINCMAILDDISPFAMQEIEGVLRNDLLHAMQKYIDKKENNVKLASLIRNMPRIKRKKYLSILQEKNYKIAEYIEEQIFDFDDLLTLDFRGIQKLVESLEQGILVRALKGASSKVQDLFFSNISENMADRIREEWDSSIYFAKDEVLKAQKVVMQKADQMLSENLIFIADGGRL